MSVNISNLYQELGERVIAASNSGQPLIIKGGGSKQFYGRNVTGEVINIRSCSGIIAYEPTELVITAYAGTPIREIENTLAERGQMLPFEPPGFGDYATLGGTVACGLSGPGRPYAGGVRDYVLGIKCLTGKGEILTFGGQVMKNVAGYDVSRLMTGALGTLGIILEVSIKVLPQPEYEIALTRKIDFNTALSHMNAWAGKSLSLSAACYHDGQLDIRLSGKKTAVASARKILAMEESDTGLDYWRQLREQQLAFFKDTKPLWRLSVPSTTGNMDLAGEWLIDWGGAQRWLKTDEPVDKLRRVTEQAGGHATLFRGGDHDGEVFQPLKPALMQLHLRLKQVFDPDRILNRGRMYHDF